MDLGERIKMMRKMAHWTQVDLAKRAGVSQQLIAKLESGEVKETRKLPQIADAFGITVDALISMTDKFEALEEQKSYEEMQITREPPHTTTDLSEDEIQLVEAYRFATPEGKEAILGAASGSYRHLKSVQKLHQRELERIKKTKPFWR